MDSPRILAMKRIRRAITVALGILCLFPPTLKAQELKAKIIAIFHDKNSTKMVVESSSAMVAGRNVYAGPKEIEITIGDLLSRAEYLYYYSGTVPGRPPIETGDFIRLERSSATRPSMLALTLKENYVFSQKKYGEITAVQGNRAMIDRGTLHEVHERDIYKIFDASGSFKGMLEVRGIGDLQSSGVIYNPWDSRKKTAHLTQQGDRIVFAGQRKMFGLGAVGGGPFRREKIGKFNEKSSGVGLLWSLTFPDGWAFELLFGGFTRKLDVDFVGGDLVTRSLQSWAHEAKYFAPIWIKKNFFYPEIVSPFIGLGAVHLKAENLHHFKRYCTFGSPCAEPEMEINSHQKTTRIAPMFGGGIEFFSGRFLRPRFEVRFVDGPKLRAFGNTYNTDAWFVSGGFLTSW